MSSPTRRPLRRPPVARVATSPVAIAVDLALSAMIVLSLIFNKGLFAVVVTVAMLIAAMGTARAFLHNDIRVARSPLST